MYIFFLFLEACLPTFMIFPRFSTSKYFIGTMTVRAQIRKHLFQLKVKPVFASTCLYGFSYCSKLVNLTLSVLMIHFPKLWQMLSKFEINLYTFTIFLQLRITFICKNPKMSLYDWDKIKYLFIQLCVALFLLVLWKWRCNLITRIWDPHFFVVRYS